MAMALEVCVAWNPLYSSFSTNSNSCISLQVAQVARPFPRLSSSQQSLPFLPPSLLTNPGRFLPSSRPLSQLNCSRHSTETNNEGESVLESSESFDCDSISGSEETPTKADVFALTAGSSTHSVIGKSDSVTTCPLCGRRHALGVLGAILSSNTNRLAQAYFENYDPKKVVEAIHPARPGWYEELYAIQMQSGMKSYESQMAGYKAKLFNSLDDNTQKVLELGIGTGPNIKYYANRPGVNIIGIDPNSHMEKYARATAAAAGLLDSQFSFVQGVGEALPVATSGVDAVICTLVLCSVKDVGATLKEIQRVLKPGGSFLFLEHVAAPEGSNTRFWQNLLDPVQQFVADGCHFTRNTLGSIRQANFASVDAKNISVPNLNLLSSQIIGIAHA